MKRAVIIFLLVSSALNFKHTIYAQYEEFHRFGGGARAYGMSWAYTALAKGAEAAYWNPAFIKTKADVFLEYGKTSESDYIGNYFWCFAFGIKEISIGVSHYSNIVPEKEWKFQLSHPNTMECFVHYPKISYNGLSVSYSIWNNFSIGSTIKYVTQNYESPQRFSWMVMDIGIGYSVSEDRLRIGLVVKDLRLRKLFRDRELNYKEYYRLGFAFTFPENEDNVFMIISGDINFETFEKTYLGIGNEILIKQTVFLRCGYCINHLVSRGDSPLHLGFGLKYKNFMFDYGDRLDADFPKRISISYSF